MQLVSRTYVTGLRPGSAKGAARSILRVFLKRFQRPDRQPPGRNASIEIVDVRPIRKRRFLYGAQHSHGGPSPGFRTARGQRKQSFQGKLLDKVHHRSRPPLHHLSMCPAGRVSARERPETESHRLQIVRTSHASTCGLPLDAWLCLRCNHGVKATIEAERLDPLDSSGNSTRLYSRGTITDATRSTGQP